MDTTVLETLFFSEGKVDSKCILNRFNVKIGRDVLDRIERGITSEDLQEMAAQGMPIFRYMHQITIHGLFDELENNWVMGYKNVFQNKNLSVGVKYNAIDEEKRRRIDKRLQCLDFVYRRSSTDLYYSWFTIINEENYQQKREMAKKLFETIDQSLFLGKAFCYIGQSMMGSFIFIDIHMNAILECNVEPFLNKMGATQDLLDKRNEERRLLEEEREKRWELDRQETLRKRDASSLSKQQDIDTLKTYPFIEKTSEPGTYILRKFNHDEELFFQVVFIYLPKGKKKPRHNRNDYYTLKEALAHKEKEGWNDSIYSGRLSGFKIR